MLVSLHRIVLTVSSVIDLNVRRCLLRDLNLRMLVTHSR